MYIYIYNIYVGGHVFTHVLSDPVIGRLADYCCFGSACRSCASGNPLRLSAAVALEPQSQAA